MSCFRRWACPSEGKPFLCRPAISSTPMGWARRKRASVNMPFSLAKRTPIDDRITACDIQLSQFGARDIAVGMNSDPVTGADQVEGRLFFRTPPDWPVKPRIRILRIDQIAGRSPVERDAYAACVFLSILHPIGANRRRESDRNSPLQSLFVGTVPPGRSGRPCGPRSLPRVRLQRLVAAEGLSTKAGVGFGCARCAAQHHRHGLLLPDHCARHSAGVRLGRFAPLHIYA